MFAGDEAVFSFYNGDLHLKSISVDPNWTNKPLFQIAERNNPKRTFLFVSTVLGKHIPVAPCVMKQTYKDLYKLMPSLEGKITVIGMAETAVGLAAGVYTELKADYANAVFMCSTRFKIPKQEVFCDFVEEHSHAQDQVIYGSADHEVQSHILATETLVLIDDEITTGKTLKNVVASLLNAGLNHIKKVVVVSLVSWSGERKIQFDNLPDAELVTVNLFNGQFDWKALEAPSKLVRKMPFSNLVGFSSQPIITESTWGRIPTNGNIDHLALDDTLASLPANKRYLVLGTNEYLWQPYLLATALEKRGDEVYFSSTTRSPVLEGNCIKHTKTFADNYGQGIQNFAYNVDCDLYDFILVVVETASDSVDVELLRQLGSKAKVINLSK